MQLASYEFHIHTTDEDGDVSADPVKVEVLTCIGSGYRHTARKLARQSWGPVDVARCGGGPWNDRYVGTAAPKYPHDRTSRATLFERLD